MKKVIAILISTFLVISCASTDKQYVTKVETVTVYKPVYAPPESIKTITLIVRPDLKTNHLTNEDKKYPGKVAKVALESEAQLRNYAEQLENQIQVLMEIYNRPADIVPPTTTTVHTINNKQL